MAFTFLDLDSVVRNHMVTEFQNDMLDGGPYISSRLSRAGIEAYPTILGEALRDGDPDSFQAGLSQPGFFISHEPNPSGGLKKTPSNAAQLLAHSEFNHYYARGVCSKALEVSEDAVVIVYRARPSRNPRPESEALIDNHLEARSVLTSLRTSRIDRSVSIPQVNSGLNLRTITEDDSAI